MSEGKKQKQRRGFAAMDPARVREIASLGGKRVHALGRGHRWTSEEARKAGKIGGMSRRKNNRLRAKGLK